MLSPTVLFKHHFHLFKCSFFALPLTKIAKRTKSLTSLQIYFWPNCFYWRRHGPTKICGIHCVEIFLENNWERKNYKKASKYLGRYMSVKKKLYRSMSKKRKQIISIWSARGGTFHIHVIRSKSHFSLQYQYFNSNTTRENKETYWSAFQTSLLKIYAK